MSPNIPIDNNIKYDADIYKWDLSALYPHYNSTEFNYDIKNISDLADKFKKNYDINNSKLSSKTLFISIAEYEIIEELSAKIFSYAYLLYSTNLNNNIIVRFYQNTSEKINIIAKKLVFFPIILRNITDKNLQKFYKQHPDLEYYKPYLRDLRVFKPYQLNQDIEEIIIEHESVAYDAWIRLFDQTLAKIKCQFNNKELSITEILNYFLSSEQHIRQMAADSLGESLKDNIEIFTYIFNVIIKYKTIIDDKRNFKKCDSSRHISNLIEPKVVNLLSSTVQQNYANIAHRYYKYKANQFGVKSLKYFDRNAPYPNSTNAYIPFSEAKEIVLNAYDKFSPQIADIACQFFEKKWIDIYPYEGKEHGAYSHPTVPSAHPYILLNYQGNIKDVMTLAHELGHGIHQILASEQGFFVSDTPLTLAETASIFGEQLVFQELLLSEPDQNKKKLLIAGKIEDMINTVVRQIAFYEFEKKLHNARRQHGELLTEQISNIWLQAQTESLGSYIEFGENYKYYWAYIPHFIHSPFYVYSYAFGECLVNSLYSIYQSNPYKFAEKYIHMLSSGGKFRYKELLSSFNLYPTKQEFWQLGIDIIIQYIDILENSN